VPAESTARLPVLAGLVVGGAVLGLVGVGVIALDRTVGSVTVPWGAVLAVLGVVASVRGAAYLVGSRRGGSAVLLGWLVPTFAFSAVNPGADVVLTDEPRTYAYLLATFGLGLLAASWPLPVGAAELAVGHGRRHEDDEEPDLDGGAAAATTAGRADAPEGFRAAGDRPMPGL
jgi:hypothetical protein